MLKNFLWQREDEPQNALAYLFIFINICYGFMFSFNPNSPTVLRSAFNSESAYIPTPLWGVLCVVLAATTLLSIAFRPRLIGQAVGAFGFMLWLYGFQIYLANGMVFAACSFYLTQMIFWAFWFIGVNRFYKREDSVVQLDTTQE